MLAFIFERATIVPAFQNLVIYDDRSSYQGCSINKGVLRNSAKFTGKYLCQSLFFNKVAGLGLQLY